jgi:hypothetical protein
MPKSNIEILDEPSSPDPLTNVSSKSCPGPPSWPCQPISMLYLQVILSTLSLLCQFPTFNHPSPQSGLL